MDVKSYSVVIIGAGLAGLSCAKCLIENNIDDFIILEASDRIGGRCQTIQFSEHQIELGGEVLHGQQSNNPLYQLAEEYHLLNENHNEFDRDDCYHDEDGESIDEDIIDKFRSVYDETLEKIIPTYPYENYPDASLGELLSAELNHYLKSKQITVGRNEFNQRDKVIHWLNKQHPYLNMIGSENLTDISVQGWNSFEHLPTNGGIKYIQGGFINLLKTVFMSKISNNRIQFHSIVKHICFPGNGQYVRIEVLRENEERVTYHAKHLVCTQSIGCLKRTMHEMFVPPLPYAKQMSIERLGFATINKIYLIFSQPFWDVDFNRFNFLWSINLKWKLNCLEKTFYDSQWCKSITGFYVHPRLSNILVTQIHGEAAEYIESIPDELLSNCFQELFCHFYPDNQIPKPKQLIRSQWFTKSFIHGSHTFIELGSSIHDIKQYAKPWSNKSSEPKIFFAGEGTHERFYGTMHGAFLTGIREAKRIIQLKKSF